MIRFPCQIATSIPHKSLGYHGEPRELIDMKRLLALASLVATAAPLAAATVGGKVNFVMKKGQAPVVAETLVWLEPPARKTAAKPPPTLTLNTHGETRPPPLP